jgi:hypothetical protein
MGGWIKQIGHKLKETKFTEPVPATTIRSLILKWSRLAEEEE